VVVVHRKPDENVDSLVKRFTKKVRKDGNLRRVVSRMGRDKINRDNRDKK